MYVKQQLMAGTQSIMLALLNLVYHKMLVRTEKPKMGKNDG